MAIYVLVLLDKRRNTYDGIMTNKQGFISGLIITGIVTFLSLLTQVITSTIITPEYFPNIIALSVEQGKMTHEAAKAYINLNNYIVQGLNGASITGILTTLIVAFIRIKIGKIQPGRRSGWI